MSFLLKNNSIQQKNKRNYKIVSKKIDEILKQINIKKNSYHSLSKKFSFDIFKKKLNKYKKFPCPVAEKITKTILNLPMYPALKFSEIKYIVNSLKQEIKNN